MGPLLIETQMYFTLAVLVSTWQMTSTSRKKILVRKSRKKEARDKEEILTIGCVKG